MPYMFAILFLIALSIGLGFTVGFFVAKNLFYQKGRMDEAAMWKQRDQIQMKEGVRIEG